ncbi:MAG: TIGR00304 family protein [Methanobacteriaceae archaeon]|jgi:uncharacterized protein (TIGR00304 family)|nr:TIGR00304 family protein [Methanobacteriaceae archaeon]
MVQGSTIITVGILVIFIGFILIFAGTALQTSGKTSDVKTGGVVLIGPIPIIFGSDKGTIVTAVIMAVILMILAYFLFYRGLRIF